MNINTRDINGNTPLILAIYPATFKGYKLVSELLVQGADPTIRNKEGLSPLSLASLLGDKKLINLLKQKG